jgi:hypothetical protein
MQQKNIMRGSPKSSQSCDLHKGWLSLWMLRSLADPIVPKLGHTPSLPAVGQKLMKIWMKFHRAYSVPKLDKNLGSTTKVRKKVKIYFWRLIDDGLMLCTQLKRQRLKDGVSCLLCDKESLVHSFWSFSHSTLTWNLMSAEVGVSFEKPPNPLICHSELRGCLLDWIWKKKGKKVSWMIMFIYNMWQSCNDAHDDDRIEDPSSIVKKTHR